LTSGTPRLAKSFTLRVASVAPWPSEAAVVDTPPKMAAEPQRVLKAEIVQDAKLDQQQGHEDDQQHNSGPPCGTRLRLEVARSRFN
jgi:hypothetical protein